jgi:methyl-accepting chemotaxis protein
MDSNQVLMALRREKALLEHVLELAECQLGLIRAGRLEDVEIVLLLRAESMSELANAEVKIGGEMRQIVHDLKLTTKELEELNSLNVLISNLANRIADIDDRANELAEVSESFWPPERPAQTEIY